MFPIKGKFILNIITIAAIAVFLTLGSAFSGMAYMVDAHTESLESEDPLRPITNIFSPEGAFSCMVGPRPDPSVYPDKVRVEYQIEPGINDQMDLPVEWNLRDVDFTKAGIYNIQGTFTYETLNSNKLRNPKNLSPSLLILVQKAGPIDSLTGAGITINKNGWTSIRLRMPELPAEVKTLRIYESPDGRFWQKAVWKLSPSHADTPGNDNFLYHTVTSSPYQYVTYRFQTNYRPICLRIEVEGSAYEGLSNSVRFDTPGTVGPGKPLNEWNTTDDGSFDGNMDYDGQGSSGGAGGGSISSKGTASGPGGGAIPGENGGAEGAGGSGDIGAPIRRGGAIPGHKALADKGAWQNDAGQEYNKPPLKGASVPGGTKAHSQETAADDTLESQTTEADITATTSFDEMQGEEFLAAVEEISTNQTEKANYRGGIIAAAIAILALCGAGIFLMRHITKKKRSQ